MTPNILATRYASDAMVSLWSPEAKVLRERKLWLCVLEAQRDLGVAIPAEAVEAFRANLSQIDLASIAARERITRHDVKARIEEYCALAGYEHIHRGLTSRDVTENVEQTLVREALLLVQSKAATALCRLTSLAEEFCEVPVAARTHNVVAQTSTLGKRFATTGEELLESLKALDSLLERQKLRGIKGAVGTQQDLLEMFEGDHSKVEELERRVAAELGFETCLGAVGQIYPRSIDAEVVSCLLYLVSGPASLATTLRLMAGQGHSREGFADEQVGSSAMPHKMNARLCERIGGLKIILGGHMAMAVELSGSQWNEGDVSCSVVRRVMLPDAFYTCDAILETFISVLHSLEVFEDSLRDEIEANLVPLASSRLLAVVVDKGLGREEAHSILRKHLATDMKASEDLKASEGKISRVANSLGADTDFPMTAAEVKTLLAAPDTSAAQKQVQAFAAEARQYLNRFPQASQYLPAEIV